VSRETLVYLSVAELVVFSLFDGGGVDERSVEDDDVREHERRDGGVEQRQVVERLKPCQLSGRPVHCQAGVQLKQAAQQVVRQ